MMSFEPKTIREHIECLARMTGASDSFIGQVQDLFVKRGIPLESDATPYLQALDEAFRREESIRANAQRARQNLTGLQTNFNRIGQAYVKKLEQLKKIQSGLREQKAQQRVRRIQQQRQRQSAPTVTIEGDHRTYVTRPQREDLPMVPGPSDPQ